MSEYARLRNVRYRILRVKRTTSELYTAGRITREELKNIRRISKGAEDDLQMAMIMVKQLYSKNNLPEPTFEP